MNYDLKYIKEKYNKSGYVLVKNIINKNELKKLI